jgi:cob(I)alamin adenosyltransferase
MTENDAPPEEDPRPEDGRRVPSLLMVNTGDGKGKSTAAFGTMLRSVSMGWRVGVIQFLKSGDWKVGEEKVATELGVDWWAMGEGFTWDSDNLEHDRSVAAGAWAKARETIESDEYRLVILDEITYMLSWGWIDVDEVIAVLTGRPEKVNVICTGRDAPEKLIEAADTVTEMRKISHAYDDGILAKKGIDY